MTDGEQIYTITAETDGERLDVFLSSVSGLTRSAIQKHIEAGRVAVNGRPPVKCGDKLKGGAVVSLLRPPPEDRIEKRDIPIRILYEDDDIAVIDKQQGLTVHPAGGNRDQTLVNALLFHLHSLSGIGGVIRPGIVHRLDKDTSGVMVVAKNDRAHVSLAEQIKNRTVKKEYRAILEGVPKQTYGRVEQPVGRDPKDRKRMAITPNGRYALTEYKIVHAFERNSYAAFLLHTGRTHQIRVHMKAIGHPVAGDKVYGYKKQRFNTEGQLLHAFSLTFAHPVSGKTLSFTAPLPPHFVEVYDKLCRESGGGAYDPARDLPVF